MRRSGRHTREKESASENFKPSLWETHPTNNGLFHPPISIYDNVPLFQTHMPIHCPSSSPLHLRFVLKGFYMSTYEFSRFFSFPNMMSFPDFMTHTRATFFPLPPMPFPRNLSTHSLLLQPQTRKYPRESSNSLIEFRKIYRECYPEISRM